MLSGGLGVVKVNFCLFFLKKQFILLHAGNGAVNFIHAGFICGKRPRGGAGRIISTPALSDDVTLCTLTAFGASENIINK